MELVVVVFLVAFLTAILQRKELLRYLLWRPLGLLIFKHQFTFEDLPFCQALSMLGHTLAFTHSKAFYLLTYAYDWSKVAVKKSAIIRLGVFGGTAQSASSFMLAAAKSPYAELSAVGSRTFERGKACCIKYSVPIAYSPYGELLSDSMIDGVVVFCPISTHECLIKKILASGKHAILIPPIAANTCQLKRLIQHRRDNHPGLMCVSAYAALGHPINHKMKDIIKRGEIGVVQKISIKAYWPPHAFNSQSIQFQYAMAGGAWEDLGPHCVSLARFMLGETQSGEHHPFTVLSAVASVPVFAKDVDETMLVEILYGNVRLDIKVSFVKPMEMSIKVEGTRGTLTQTQWYRPEMYHRMVHKKSYKTTVHSHRGQDEEQGKASWEYLMENMVAALQESQTPLMGSEDEELYTLEIIDEVYRKSGLGIRCPDS